MGFCFVLFLAKGVRQTFKWLLLTEEGVVRILFFKSMIGKSERKFYFVVSASHVPCEESAFERLTLSFWQRGDAVLGGPNE